MNTIKQFSAGITLLLASTLTACGGGGGNDGNKMPNSVSSFSSLSSGMMSSLSQSTNSSASSSSSSENNFSLTSSSSESSFTQSENFSVSSQSSTSSASNAVLVWGVATPIESASSNTNSPAIAVRENGDAIAIWQQSAAGNRTEIWFNRYTLATGWATPESIPINNLESAINPVIAIDKAGNAIAAWMQGPAPGVSANIYVSRYTTSNGWNTPTRISNSGGFAYDHHLAMNANGNAVLVWVQHDGVENSVYTNHFIIEDGWGANTLAENSNFEVEDLAVAIDSNNNTTVVWVESEVTSNVNLWANYYVAGVGWGTATLIETAAGSTSRPKVAMDSSGNAIAVWNQNGVWSNRYVPNVGWGAATNLDSSSTDNAFSPSIAMDSEGNATVAWQQTDDITNIPFYILARRYVVDEGWDIETMPQTDSTGSAQSPVLATDINGNVIAIWQQLDEEKATVWANRFTLENGWGIASLLETIDAGEAAYYGIGMDANGRTIAIWQQSDGSRNNIMVNHFSDQ